MINKEFTYKGFSELSEAFDYAEKAMKAEATYVEVMVMSVRLKYQDMPIIVQHNAKTWIR